MEMEVDEQEEAGSESEPGPIPMEVDPGPSREVLVAQMIANKRERKKLKFRQQMQRFDSYCTLTGLTVDDLNWPLISGRSLQRKRLTGLSYRIDNVGPQLHEKLNQFEIYRFLELTEIQLYAAGAGFVVPDDIKLFVFQRTVKTIVAYCNHMYESAKRKGRSEITRFELHDLIQRDEFRFYLYFRHFLPYPDPEAHAFNNHFTALLHQYYFKTDGMMEFWNNPEMLRFTAERGVRLVQNQERFYPVNFYGFTDAQKYRTTFTAPDGLQFSAFYAQRFHEALGMPPLETEIIAVLDWLAKIVITEIVYITSLWCDQQKLNTLPTVGHYRLAMENHEDVLFDLAIDNLSRCTICSPFSNIRPPRLDVSSYYRTVERKLGIEAYMNDFYARQYAKTNQLFTMCSLTVRDR